MQLARPTIALDPKRFGKARAAEHSAPFAGVLQKILVAEDETVPVGTELAVVGGTAAAVQPALVFAGGDSPAWMQSAAAKAAKAGTKTVGTKSAGTKSATAKSATAKSAIAGAS